MGGRAYPAGPRGGREEGAEERFLAPTDAQVRDIIVKGDVVILINEASRVGEMISKQKLTTSQIRNVFGTARQIQLRWNTTPEQSYREAVLLIPKLGYFSEREKRARGDQRSAGMETLQKTLEPCLRLLIEAGISDVEKEKRFQRFMDFFEAIVAYHKRFGGK